MREHKCDVRKKSVQIAKLRHNYTWNFYGDHGNQVVFDIAYRFVIFQNTCTAMYTQSHFHNGDFNFDIHRFF